MYIIKHTVKLYSAILLSLSLSACVTTAPEPYVGTLPQASIQYDSLALLKQEYRQSVTDAKRVEAWERSEKLTRVTIDNPSLKWNLIEGEKHIRVASWKKDTSFYKPREGSLYYNTGAYPIWVTLAPQLQDICREKNFGGAVGYETRLRQILGLTPDSNYTSFVEFWVKPRDLFRPCPDPEIMDAQCDLDFPAGVSAKHRSWIDEQRRTNDYPWTQLGYTYDWNAGSGNHVGVSEFVIRSNADVVVAGISSTGDYCAVN